mgnify:CR=1 FL=1
MALQFVLGSAGSGKSGYVFRKTVKEAQKNLKKNSRKQGSLISTA